MNSEISSAIKNKQVISFQYDGGQRTAEPHYYGTGSAGQELLRAYQTSGASSSGNSEGWKLFKVDGMTSIEVTSNQFTSARSGYNSTSDKQIINLIAKL